MRPTRPVFSAHAVAGALGVVLVLCAGCEPSPQREPARGGTVRAVLWKDPLSLSLIGTSDYYSDILARLLTDSLVQYDAKLRIEPQLATSWEVSDGGRTVTFHLREGVRWHDGSPVTAEDVVFSVEAIRDPKNQARGAASDFVGLASVQALDPRTVRARYQHPNAGALDAWTIPIVPRHAAGKEPDLLTSAFAQHPVGCGPFRFVHWRRGEEIRLEANPEYWGGRPFLDALVFRIIPDDRTAYQALVRGDVDIMALTPDLWREAKGNPRAKRLRPLLYYPLRVYYLGWNHHEPNSFFEDPRVRRALIHALDRERFIDKILGEKVAIRAATTFHPESTWTDPTVKPWPYDPAASRTLLAEAGWLDRDGDGVIERDGIPFRFRLMVSGAMQEIAERMAAWIQTSLADVGVRVEIERIEWSAFQERRSEHRYESALATFTLSPNPDQTILYHSSSVEDGLNYVGFVDPEVDQLLEQGNEAMDPGVRKAIYARLQHRLHAMEPISCLFHFAAPVLRDHRLEGVQSSPLDLYRFTPGPRQWRWSSPQGHR